MSGAALSIFIPAFNAASTLPDVIRRVPDHVWQRVINCWIINDGSADETGQVIYSLALVHNKIRAVHFSKNRGYGAVAKKGLALCRNDGCDVAVCLHADGQYPPEQIGQFADTMAQQHIDILQGSRIASGTALSGGMPMYKFIAGKVLTFFENRILGLHMTDYHSGFMLYSSRLIERLAFESLSASFDFDLEMIASARANGFKVAELPIPTTYAGEKSYLNPISYGLRVVGVMVRYLAGKYRGHA